MRVERGYENPWRQCAIEFITATAGCAAALLLAPPPPYDDPARLIAAFAALVLVGLVAFVAASHLVGHHPPRWRLSFRRTRADEMPGAFVGLAVTMLVLGVAFAATGGRDSFTPYVVGFYCGGVVRMVLTAWGQVA